MPVLPLVSRQMSLLRRLTRENNHVCYPAKYLSYRPGDLLVGESFTRATVATYFDVNGLLQQANANVKRDAHYISGTRTLLIEAARTNIETHKRDFTNAAWVKTTMTPLKDQTGIDGSANAASSLLATGANATVLQTIVDASKARFKTAYVKRLIGAGNIDMTMDNGVTWTTISGSINGATYTRVSIPTQTLANPIVGFRIVTSGDKIAVDWSQTEDGTFASTPIGTLADNAAAETRNGEQYNVPALFGEGDTTLYASFIDQGTQASATGGIAAVGNFSTNPSFNVFASDATHWNGAFHNGAAQVLTGTFVTSVVSGDSVEMRAMLTAAGTIQFGRVRNGGAEGLSAVSAGQALGAGWGGSAILLGRISDTANRFGFAGFTSLKVLSGIRTMSELRAA